jgi:lipopolysaccharide biosynthesis regulator YciM
MKNILKISLIIVGISAFVEAKQDGIPEVDHLALASMMVYDGKFAKANKELLEAKKQDENLDLSKYYTIKGVIAMRQEKHVQAIDYLKKAVTATKTKVYLAPAAVKGKRKHLFSIGSEPEAQVIDERKVAFDAEKLRKEQLQRLYSNLSQESYKVKNYMDTIKYLDLQGPAGRDQAAEYMLRADCYWKSEKKDSAVGILTEGAKAFPSDQSLLKQKFYYFTELGLYQEAIFSAKAYMKRAKPNAKEYMALSQMLLKVLEETKMLFPTNAKVNMLLGHLYMKKGMEFTTANLFEQGSYYEHKYVKEAAELHRRVGLIPHALYLNSQITIQNA